MENGSDLIRRIGLLEQLQSGSDQKIGAAMWVLAVGLRQLASDLAATQGALASVVKENDLDVADEWRAALSNSNDSTRSLFYALERVVSLFEPLQAPD